MKLVTIIIPVYNSEKEIFYCLDSVLKQTYNSLEVIVINDGSTDFSGDIVLDFAKKDSRIKYFYQKHSGVSTARNRGIEISTGEFIMFVDSDDWIDETFVEKMVECIEETDADIVECGYMQWNEKEGGGKSYLKTYSSYEGTELILQKHLAGEIAFLVWNKCYRRHIAASTLFEEGQEYEDVFWTCSVLGQTNKIVSVQEPLYMWRERQGSISRRKFDKRHFTALESFDKCVELCKGFGEGCVSIAKTRVITECYLELCAAKNTDEQNLIRAAKRHSMVYFNKNKLSFTEWVKLKSWKGKVRYLYYFVQYQRNL